MRGIVWTLVYFLWVFLMRAPLSTDVPVDLLLNQPSTSTRQDLNVYQQFFACSLEMKQMNEKIGNRDSFLPPSSWPCDVSNIFILNTQPLSFLQLRFSLFVLVLLTCISFWSLHSALATLLNILTRN